jgi:hypothetical protein
MDRPIHERDAPLPPFQRNPGCVPQKKKKRCMNFNFFWRYMCPKTYTRRLSYLAHIHPFTPSTHSRNRFPVSVHTVLWEEKKNGKKWKNLPENRLLFFSDCFMKVVSSSFFKGFFEITGTDNSLILEYLMKEPRLDGSSKIERTAHTHAHTYL